MILIEDITPPEPIGEDTMTFELNIEEMQLISKAMGYYWLNKPGLGGRKSQYVKSMSQGFLEAYTALQTLVDARLRKYGEK